MQSRTADMRTLERLLPTENGLTVFDADTQETSYGIAVFEGLPFILDTHQKDGRYVATIELLTEVVAPVRVSRVRLDRFLGIARRQGLDPIPYSCCFFKGNLHVYGFFGPVRGLDLATVGNSASDAEAKLKTRVRKLWGKIPFEVLEAQRELLSGRRAVRYRVDLEVLVGTRKRASIQDSP